MRGDGLLQRQVDVLSLARHQPREQRGGGGVGGDHPAHVETLRMAVLQRFPVVGPLEYIIPLMA